MTPPDRVESARAALLASARDVPDFPSPGIMFKDIAPTLADGPTFATVVEGLLALIDDLEVDAVVGIESRGFLVGAPVALGRGCGLILVRKPGKLPGPVMSIDYDLEYGSASLQMQTDALGAFVGRTPKVVIVDDVLATGGTMAAAAQLLTDAGADVVALLALMEIRGLRGAALDHYDVRHLTYV